MFTSKYDPTDGSVSVSDSFVNSQEWTLSRSVPDLRLGIVGSLSSGKSALVHRYLTGSYMQEESPEGGRFKKEILVDNQSYLLLIRDEGGPPELQVSFWLFSSFICVGIIVGVKALVLFIAFSDMINLSVKSTTILAHYSTTDILLFVPFDSHFLTICKRKKFGIFSILLRRQELKVLNYFRTFSGPTRVPCHRLFIYTRR